ncbi:MAG: excinuclease ABC subunit UvrC [Oscillospiraceae bacterium]|nr:excinuclease ABC subunit UvrC [Oscillospiraceae bacterium]
MNEKLDFLREKAGKLTRSPGVYLMKDKGGKIIYIGKAKVLRTRVSSYFNNVFALGGKTYKLVSLICDFDFIVTNSELDALVLEASLIKQHTPKYNIKLKDSSGYNYIKVTGGDYPKISYTLKTDDKEATYLGPYTSGYNIRLTVDETCRIFMLPSCGKKFPQEFIKDKKSRPCLNYHIKRCSGICRGKTSKEEYNTTIQAALDYIKNGAKESVKLLTVQMENAAEKLDFEQAAKFRDRINAIVKTETGQKIQTSKTTDYDIVTIALDAELASAAVIKYRGGRLFDKENFFLGDEYEPKQMLSDFLIEYYGAELYNDSVNITAVLEENKYTVQPVPPEIYTEEEPEDKELLESFFAEKRGKKVNIIVPKRGEGLTQVMLAKNNAREYLSLKVGRSSKELGALEELAKILGLAKPPLYIESYDISNMGENIKAGGMVVYKNGKPFKANYRKFTIKEVAGLDDYACMREVLSRRFKRYIEINANTAPADTADSAFSVFPDLILLDGGKGHVSAVREVLNELGLDVNLFGMVKDEKHRTRAIAADGGEIQVAANKQVFGLLTNIQDEVHRFSLSFQRNLHKKKTYELELTKVPGIGGKKAAALLKEFKTKQALKEASAEELAKAAKITMEKAKELKAFVKENF